MSNAAIDYDDLDGLDDLISDVQNEAVESEAKADSKEDFESLEAISDELAEVEEMKVSHPVKIEPPKTAKKKASSTSRFANGDSLVSFGETLFNASAPLLLVAEDADLTPEEATSQNLTSIDAVKAVKVREKLANLLAWMRGDKSLSRYTEHTIKQIILKEEMTKADVCNSLLDLGLKMGTASSQAGQMTHILQVMKIAELKGGKFVLNPDSTIVSMMTPE